LSWVAPVVTFAVVTEGTQCFENEGLEVCEYGGGCGCECDEEEEEGRRR
jgi:hypothetical protein